MTCGYSSLFWLTKKQYFELVFLCFLLFCELFIILYLCMQSGDLAHFVVAGHIHSSVLQPKY